MLHPTGGHNAYVEDMTETTLKPVREDWSTGLVVVAHPDDMEFGAAAAVARWTGQGKKITYVLVTSGEAGIDAIPPGGSRQVREAEQIESCRIVGVDDVIFLGLPDGVLEYGVPLRKVITEQIRRVRPEIVITGNFHHTWDGAAMLNQADHIAVGQATLDAVRDAGNRWIFNDQLVDGLEPWGGVKQLWAASSPQGKHAVDTTDTFDVGVASLEAHRAYVDGLGWEDFDPAEFLEGSARPVGTALGVPRATSFEVYYFGWGVSADD